MQSDRPAKTYRRRIRIEKASPGVVFAALEDTAHHVRVTLTFSGDTVTSVTGEAVRLPWATCPGAAAGLTSLAGTELTASLSRLRRLYDPRANCTHFFDLAQLTMAHAASGRERRFYEVVARAEGGRTAASLARDGTILLRWTIEGGSIVEPAQFAGVGLREGFVRWCEQQFDDDGAEAAFVLRRAAGMSGIANMDMDSYAVVAESGIGPGVCFTSQPEHIRVAFRNTGSARDYSAGGEDMLDGFAESLEAMAQSPA
jgi:hypothetical protein